MTRLTVIIDDRKWPKVTMTSTRETVDGQRSTVISESMYDTSYTVFENSLHNQLRPMCQEIIDRRVKGSRR